MKMMIAESQTIQIPHFINRNFPFGEGLGLAVSQASATPPPGQIQPHQKRPKKRERRKRRAKVAALPAKTPSIAPTTIVYGERYLKRMGKRRKRIKMIVLLVLLKGLFSLLINAP